jgi:hypothetical protein
MLACVRVESRKRSWTLEVSGRGTKSRNEMLAVAGQGLCSVVHVVGLIEGVRCWTDDRDGTL